MKTKILSLAIALIALFAFSNAYASHEQWNVEPCFEGNVLTGKITGIGNGDFTMVIEGQVNCQNPVGHQPPGWIDFRREIDFQVHKNGNYNVNLDLSLCKKKWTTDVQAVSIKVYDSTGNEILRLRRNNVGHC